MKGVEDKKQRSETASVALVKDMHFVGEVGGFESDLDAEEEVCLSITMLSQVAEISATYEIEEE